jgi:hypothetical protein
MRLECANRDEKTGVILRVGGDRHALHSLLHVHRLLLALCTAEWLCALTGLQAWHDLPPQPAVGNPVQAPAAPPPTPLPSPAAATLPPLPEPLPVLASAANPPSTPVPPPALPPPTRPANSGTPTWAVDPRIWQAGPCMPPPVLPHRGPTPKLPDWMCCFAARGWLSYVRLGKEIIATAHFRHVLQRMVRWLANYLWSRTPLWRPWQLRYRLHHWWCDSS